MKTRRTRAVTQYLLTCCWLFFSTLLLAQLSTPKFFGDDMVLQRNQSTRIWGTAPAGTAVHLSLHTQLSLAFADEEGHWEAILGALPAGGPYELRIETDQESIIYENILMGEVWICAGQSNMRWSLANIPTGTSEVASSNWPEIRLFKPPNQLSNEPESDFTTGTWETCSPSTSGSFSAIAYFFGRQLHQELDVPIGLIMVAWGGTQIETWISPEGLSGFDDLQPELEQLQLLDIDHIQDSIQTAQTAWETDLDANDLGLQEGWQNDDDNWQNWRSRILPKHWTNAPLGRQSGSVWLKRSFTLTARQANEDAQLLLGTIGDSDQTWINGQLVGNTEHQPELSRTYAVTANLLQEGENTVTVRVRNDGSSEILTYPNEEMSLFGDPWQVSLSGHWHSQRGVSAPEIPQFPPPLNPNDYPSLIYNGMVNPFARMVMAGVIWYQGESNTGSPFYYRDKQIQIIDDWRDKWQIGDFSFITTQLPYFRQILSEPGASGWATLRESQTHALKRNNTALVTMIDSGDPTNIHPNNKYLTGTRIANNALRITYGYNNGSRGPSYMLSYRSGSTMNVIFRTYGSSLFSEQPSNIRAFVIAGEDGNFVWANAQIINNTTVAVSHPSIPNPKYVRYAWSDNPGFVNLFDATGLPARPFRSDVLPTPYE